MNTSSPNPAPVEKSKRPRLFRRRADRERRRPFRLGKALFILPNAFTISSIFCSFYAILRATTGPRPDAFYEAGIALFFSCFFDMFDGRVARLTRTQSDFGVQIDSLADVISFGVAPAILVHEWALKPFGFAGLFVSFGFAACGAIRLARFNVLAARGQGSSKFFIGLPIPGAAMMLVSLVIAQTAWLHAPVEARTSVLLLTIVLSYLMVSHVRFRTFKEFRPSVRTAPLVLLVLAALGASLVLLRPSITLVLAVGCYIFAGLAEEVVFFRRRRRDAHRAAVAQAPTSDAAGESSSPPVSTTA